MQHWKSEKSSEPASLFKAKCRSRSGAVGVDVLDLSTVGCMVGLFGSTFSPGDNVSIQLPGLRYMRAKIVWTDENSAGLQFEEPLYEPVLAHLLASQSA